MRAMASRRPKATCALCGISGVFWHLQRTTFEMSTSLDMRRSRTIFGVTQHGHESHDFTVFRH